MCVLSFQIHVKVKYSCMSFSSSFSQLDSSTWNIDMQELEYNPSKKDLTDAKIHHLLAEELVKPYRRVGCLSNIDLYCEIYCTGQLLSHETFSVLVIDGIQRVVNLQNLEKIYC